MAKLIALIPVHLLVDGERIVIEPGEPLPPISAHDARELKKSNSVLDETEEAARTRKADQATEDGNKAFQAERRAVMAAQASTEPKASKAATAPPKN